MKKKNWKKIEKQNLEKKKLTFFSRGGGGGYTGNIPSHSQNDFVFMQFSVKIGIIIG